MRKIGFITCAHHANLYHDDRHLLAPFAASGVEIVPIIWTQANDLQELDALVFRSAWDYHLKTAQFETWLKELEKIDIPIFNPLSVIQHNYDKFYLQDLEEAGKSIIPTQFFESVADLDLSTVLAKHNWKKAVLKPAISMSAYQTFLVTEANQAELQNNLVKHFGETKVILQEFAEEIVEEGEWSLIFFNKQYFGTVLKQPKQGDFRVQGELGGTFSWQNPAKKIIQQAQELLDFYKVPLLYARVDGIVRGGNFCLMELELIDPELFFRANPQAVKAFMNTLIRK